MWHETPYFLPFIIYVAWKAEMRHWFPPEMKCAATSEISVFLDESYRRKHLLNGYVLIYQDKRACKHTAHEHCKMCKKKIVAPC